MTHSNHRRGSRESLEGDYVIFTYPSKKLEDNKKILEIYANSNPVSCTCAVYENGKRTRKRWIKGWDKSKDSGIHKSAGSLEELKRSDIAGYVSGVFDNKESAKKVVRELGEGDFGCSTVVSTIFDNTRELTHNAPNAYMHTVNMSAETFGKTELLPEPKILEITTMCGHHMPSQYLVKHLIEQVRRKRMTAQEAAVEIAKQCTCNFVNVARAEKLINEYLEDKVNPT